jgi:hypothetical protein
MEQWKMVCVETSFHGGTIPPGGPAKEEKTMPRSVSQRAGSLK